MREEWSWTNHLRESVPKGGTSLTSKTGSWDSNARGGQNYKARKQHDETEGESFSMNPSEHTGLE